VWSESICSVAWRVLVATELYDMHADEGSIPPQSWYSRACPRAELLSGAASELRALDAAYEAGSLHF
jgi:hypothetical protein